MSDIALRIEGLGKQYRIGRSEAGGGMYRYRSLRDAFANVAKRPLDLLKRDRVLTDDNSFWALKDVGFEVKRGEVVGIIGRNGAGKSTLLKILSRITKPTVGHVELRGRVGSLLEVGTGFHPELTGRENIYLNGAVLGMTRAEVRGKFDEIVAFSEIERFLDTPVKQYSSGMYMRLAFAVAAHLEPEILVVDEVLAVGDAAFQKKCLGKMKDVADEGRTVLFVSHNMGAVRQLCDCAIVLRLGQIADYGNAEAAVQAYLEETTRNASERVGWKPMGGTGEFRITDCRLRQTSYDPCEPKIIDVGIQRSQEKATPVHVVVELYNGEGNRVLKADSRHVQKLVPADATVATCTFTLRHPWLAPGEYRIDVSLASFTRIDGVEDAARLHVADVFPYLGTGSFDELRGLSHLADFDASIAKND